MIRVINKLTIKRGRAEEVLEKFKDPKSVHTFEGFVFMEVMEKQNVEEHDELHIATTWENEDSFQNWRDSRQNSKAHGSQESEDNPILDFEISKYDIHYRHLPE